MSGPTTFIMPMCLMFTYRKLKDNFLFQYCTKKPNISVITDDHLSILQSDKAAELVNDSVIVYYL